MRNTQAQPKGMKATGGGNKSDSDMLSKQLPGKVTLASGGRFSYNIGRKVNNTNRAVPKDNKVPSEYISETKTGQNHYTKGNDKNASKEMRETTNNEIHGRNISLKENHMTGAARQMKCAFTIKHGSTNKAVSENKTRNSAFENRVSSPRKSSNEHVQKLVDTGDTEIDKESERIDHVVVAADGMNNERNVETDLSHKRDVNKITDSNVQDGLKDANAKKSIHLRIPAFESEKQVLAKHGSSTGFVSADTPSDSSKFSLSQRSSISIASSTESANSLFDKILESRATMSNGSSDSLQDMASRRISFQIETTNLSSHEKWEAKGDGNSLVIKSTEIRQEANASLEKKHGPDTQKIDGENNKPIIKRTKQRRILET